jgi:hypothetical protein
MERLVVNLETAISRIDPFYAQSRDCPETLLAHSAIQGMVVAYLQLRQALRVFSTQVSYLVLS